MSMIGRTYRLGGSMVRVLARWRSPDPGERGGPRNVLLEDIATGHRFVRPFRGLRKIES